jgi:phage gp36-like protein
MGYCTKKDLIALVTEDKELKRLIESANVDEDYIIQQIIEDASSIVDIYIRVDDNASNFAKGRTAQISVYRLFQRINPIVPEPVEKGFIEAMQMLKDAQKNNVKVSNVTSSKASALNKKVSYESPLYLNY